MNYLPSNYYYALSSSILTKKLGYLLQDYNKMNQKIKIPINNLVWIIESENYFNTTLPQIKMLNPKNMFIVININTLKERENVKNKITNNGLSASIYERTGFTSLEDIARDINRVIFTEICLNIYVVTKRIFKQIIQKFMFWSRRNVNILLIIFLFILMFCGLLALMIEVFKYDVNTHYTENLHELDNEILKELNDNIKYLIETVKFQNIKIDRLIHIVKDVNH